MRGGRKFSAVVLAAGESTRMGAFKPLMTMGGMTLAEHAVALFKHAGIDDVLTVVGHRAGDLIPTVEQTGSRWVASKRFSEGMYASVAAGVEQLDPRCEAFFVLPVDMPLVRRRTVERLSEHFRPASDPVLYPFFLNRRGHPPLISMRLKDPILAYSGQGGLRTLLKQYESAARNLEVADANIHLDVDSPVDYELLIDKYGRRDIPSRDESLALINDVLQVAPATVAHCKAVARLAEELGRALNRAGCRLDLDQLTAAALLHDVARDQPDHAAAGATLLRKAGFNGVARLVAAHIDIDLTENEPISEAAILYLADKMTTGTRRVDLKERFRRKMNRFAGNSDARQAVTRRLNSALTIKTAVESKIRHPLETVVGHL